MALETPLSSASDNSDITAPLSSVGAKSKEQVMYDKQMADLDEEGLKQTRRSSRKKSIVIPLSPRMRLSS